MKRAIAMAPVHINQGPQPMMTRASAARLLARNDHASRPCACPLLIHANYEAVQNGIAGTYEDILSCDRGFLFGWMGY